jgi:uncharacterized membrane protein
MTRSLDQKIVDYSAGTLLLVAIAGQWAFAAYILFFYACPAVSGHLQVWNSNALLAQPPVEAGKWLSTCAFGAHAIGASVIALFGGLQIIPMVRNRWRRFHRWNGRVFVFTVVALCISGYYLTWIRGPLPDSLSDFGTSVNGALILGFAAMTVIAAMNKRFAEHERWAVRLFLVSNAQWFLRIGGFGYFVIAKSLGYEIAFDSWFFQFWTWGCFIVPLAVSELYFATRRTDRKFFKWGSAALFILLTPLTLVGIVTFGFFSIQVIQGAV